MSDVNRPHMKQYIKTKKNGRKGLMISFIDPNDEKKALIGWSLWDTKKDKYDPDLAIDIAYKRAIKWKNATQVTRKENVKKHILNQQFKKNILTKQGLPVPGFINTVILAPSVCDPLLKFIHRCDSYYKNQELVKWAAVAHDQDIEIKKARQSEKKMKSISVDKLDILDSSCDGNENLAVRSDQDPGLTADEMILK